MAKPWDSLPLPRDGDLDEKVTYEWLGRVLCRWELIEFTLARLYSLFVDDPDGSLALREFGEGRTVPDRDKLLRSAAEKWFAQKGTTQKTEGRFDKFMQEYVGFSDRRNEVAHGIVHPVSGMNFFLMRTTRPHYRVQYAVIPAYHIAKRYHPNGVPKYMYTLPELSTLYERLTDLQFAMFEFLVEFDPRESREGR